MRQRRVDERMDDLALDRSEHDRALAGLVRLNAWSRSHRLLLEPVVREARSAGPTGITLLDVATGSADGPVRMAVHARSLGLRVRLILADASEHALAVAAARARAAGVDADTLRCDVLAAPIPAQADVVTCSLFVHHLDRSQAVTALRRMAQAARRTLAVADLERSKAGLLLAWGASRALSRSAVVHFDAPASVHGAYALDEVRALAQDAGLRGAVVRRRWPFRWTLECSRT